MTISHLAHGWVGGRGTIDILHNCFLTIYLSSWSVLFLNVPAEEQKHAEFFANKGRWMLFTILFPEMMTGIAAEQWRSARQAVEDFSKLEQLWKGSLQSTQTVGTQSALKQNLSRLRRFPWTMRHAFFADMGGIRLHCPDFVPFPVDSQQLLYLIDKGHLQYPELDTATIWDKNKADGFARAITLVQITWFSIQCLGRGIQHLALSTIELSTLSFIFCTMGTLFFCAHKPLDVGTPIVLACPTRLEEILVKAENQVVKRYTHTPLDFIKPPTSRSSLVTPFWFGFKVVFDWRTQSTPLPVKTFGNGEITPPRGLKIPDILSHLS